MKIGDRVRVLFGNEEGIVTKIVDKDLVEVEVEDGFQIPFMKKEVVVIAQEEDQYFKKRQEIVSKAPAEPLAAKPNTRQGIYFAFLPINDRQLALYLINTLTFDLSYMIGEEQNNNFKGIAHGVLSSQKSVKIREVLLEEFDKWPTWVVQLLFFHQGYFTAREPMVQKLKCKADKFYKSKKHAPLLDKTSYLFELNVSGLSEGGKPLDMNKIKERMLGNVDEGQQKMLRLERPPKEVDLHIEKLTNRYDKMNNKEMLELQLKVFDEKMDSAIATGMEEITFVHGVGGGILKDAIQKRLSKIKNIQFFKDTQRDKFGYGATLVRIK